MAPAATGPVGTPVTGGPTQGPAGFANLMSGRSTFGGKKRRRTTSGGHAMSEAQEGKVSVSVFPLSPPEVSLSIHH